LASRAPARVRPRARPRAYCSRNSCRPILPEAFVRARPGRRPESRAPQRAPRRGAARPSSPRRQRELSGRLDRSGRAANGHAAAPPTKVMNVRRRIAPISSSSRVVSSRPRSQPGPISRRRLRGRPRTLSLEVGLAARNQDDVIIYRVVHSPLSLLELDLWKGRPHNPRCGDGPHYPPSYRPSITLERLRQLLVLNNNRRTALLDGSY